MQSHTVGVEEAKQILPALLEEALRGDEVVITRGEQPTAKLVALTVESPRQRRPRFGSAQGQIWMSDDFDELFGDLAK